MSVALPPPPAPPFYQVRHEPVGVAGWLQFFCVWLVALGPIGLVMLLSTCWSIWQDAPPQYRESPLFLGCLLATLGASAIYAAYGVVVGLLIFHGSKSGRLLAFSYLAIRLCCDLAIIAAGVASLALANGESVTAATAGSLLGATVLRLGFVIAWGLYFLFSRRVRNTYGN